MGTEAEEVREVEKEVLVDTGATMLTLPEEVVEEERKRGAKSQEESILRL